MPLAPESDPAMATTFCANHPDRETMLRCNRCEKPICYQCAVLTPVGYRCKECVRDQQSVYYNAEPADLPIGATISGALGVVFGGLAFALLGLFGWFSLIVAFITGPAVGGLVSEVVRRAVNKRRARHMKYVFTISFVVGVAVGSLLLLVLLGGRRGLLRLDMLIFTALAASTIFARFR